MATVTSALLETKFWSSSTIETLKNFLPSGRLSSRIVTLKHSILSEGSSVFMAVLNSKSTLAGERGGERGREGGREGALCVR